MRPSAQSVYESMIEKMPVAAAYVGADGRYGFVNQACERALGRPRQEIVGRHVKEVFGPDLYLQMQPDMAAALGGKSSTREGKLTCPDGAERHLQAEYLPDQDGEGQLKGFFAFLRETGPVDESGKSVSAQEPAGGNGSPPGSEPGVLTPSILEVQLKRAAALQEITETLSESQDPEALENFLSRSVQAVGADAGLLLSWDARTRRLQPSADRGFRTSASQRSSRDVAQSPAGRVAAERQTVFLPRPPLSILRGWETDRKICRF